MDDWREGYASNRALLTMSPYTAGGACLDQIFCQPYNIPLLFYKAVTRLLRLFIVFILVGGGGGSAGPWPALATRSSGSTNRTKSGFLLKISYGPSPWPDFYTGLA
jgi:hypothetical protein